MVLTVGDEAVSGPLAEQAHAKYNKDSVSIALGLYHGLPSGLIRHCSLSAGEN